MGAACVPVARGATNRACRADISILGTRDPPLNEVSVSSVLPYATLSLVPLFITMKALVKESRAPGFVLKEVPVPTIRADEVLIKVRRAGVCGTDVHIHDWDAWANGRCTPSFTVGHEFAGSGVPHNLHFTQLPQRAGEAEVVLGILVGRGDRLLERFHRGIPIVGLQRGHALLERFTPRLSGEREREDRQTDDRTTDATSHGITKRVRDLEVRYGA